MSEKLIGVRLEEDFVIESARVPLASATGSCQSTGYIARSSDGRQAFVKVLDTTVDKDAPDPIADLKLLRHGSSALAPSLAMTGACARQGPRLRMSSPRS